LSFENKGDGLLANSGIAARRPNGEKSLMRALKIAEGDGEICTTDEVICRKSIPKRLAEGQAFFAVFFGQPDGTGLRSAKYRK